MIASSHSGWRGTVGKIGEKTVQKMVSEFGCRPEDIYAAVGPSICGSCYEVSQDVADAFSAVFSEEACDQFIIDDHNGKYHLDLWDANRQILLDSGILPEHMAMPDICTCCNPKLMWSHRHTGGQRGSLAALIMQK